MRGELVEKVRVAYVESWYDGRMGNVVRRGTGCVSGRDYGMDERLTGPELGERPTFHVGRRAPPTRRHVWSSRTNLEGSSQKKGDKEGTFHQTRSLYTGKTCSVTNFLSHELLPVEI